MPSDQQKLKKKLQTVFNEFIRKRDDGKSCISCGQVKTLEAGHFFAVKGYDGLRYDEDNAHGECAKCNRFDDSHLIWYEKNLRNRIGTRRFNKLIQKAKDYKEFGYKWDNSQLSEMINVYKNRIKKL